MEIYEVIMAGGGGTRFWPISRKMRPKQFINVSGNDILLNETITRMDGIIKRENVYVVTGKQHRNIVEEEIVNGIPFSNILTEPAGRNTAPCILYAAMVLEKEKGDGVMCVFAADHHIQNVPEYQRIIKKAIKQAQSTSSIMTIGIKPTYAATGYGYIKGSKKTEDEIMHVEQFVEKPSENVAKQYVESGNYFWNSGIFVFKVSVILEAYRKYLPKMYEDMRVIINSRNTENEQEILDKLYPELESISIDYGIMEHADCVQVIAGDYGWSDVGSLDELKTFHEPDENGNISIAKDFVSVESNGCIVKSDDKLVALVGVEDLIVVDAKDTILICKKQQAQDVKKIVEKLQEEDKDKYL